MYSHPEYVQAFASANGLAFHAATNWNDLTAYSNTLRDTNSTTLIADYDETAQFANNGDDSLTARTTYTVYCFAPAEVGNPLSAPAAKHYAREIIDEYIRVLLRDAYSCREGLTHLDRASIEVTTLGMLGDWSFGLMLSYTVVTSFNY